MIKEINVQTFQDWSNIVNIAIVELLNSIESVNFKFESHGENIVIDKVDYR